MLVSVEASNGDVRNGSHVGVCLGMSRNVVARRGWAVKLR